jgi:prophage maintenance system killer protein
MDVCLDLNGIQITLGPEDIGQTIIRAARRLMDEGELAEWLRQRALPR